MNGQERGKFVSVHGIDGTGKTSTTQEVSEHLQRLNIPVINYDSYKDGQINPVTAKKKEIEKTGTNEEKLAVYLESMMYHSQTIEGLLKQGYHVVKSRYLEDIKAHFSHLGVTAETIAELEKVFPMVQPDLKVILVLNEDKRRERIGGRGILDERDEERKIEGSRLKYFEDYLLQSVENAPEGRVIKIDTASLDVEAVSKKIVDHLLGQII